MLAGFLSWWLARITELLPSTWTKAGGRVADGIVVSMQPEGLVAANRRKGRSDPLTLGVAARLAARKPVLLRPPPVMVLQKHHIVPTASRRELDQLLRYELARITPFAAADVFWGWESRPRPGDKSRTDVTLTLVPKTALAPALEALENLGIRPSQIEAGPPDRPRLLPTDDPAGQAAGHLLARGPTFTCAALAVIALILPVILQERALHVTNSDIDALQPTINQVEALRRGLSADGAGREVLAREMQRTGDVLQVLATVTRILPDDTYLTEFALHDRQMTLSGRSAAAAHLITGLSADPTIRNAGFAAPVTRLEGATTDVFSIRADIAP